MSSLLDKLSKAGTIKESGIMSKNPVVMNRDFIPTDLPILNVAFSGKIDGGLVPGLTVFAGESKTFKTLLGLYCMKAYFDKYPDAVALLYDSEFGITPEYLDSNGIDADRVIHVPVTTIEEIKLDVVSRLKEIGKDDHAFILIDSIGNLPSSKEARDAEEQKSVADMTRAKEVRSLLRLITPHLTMKSIPCIAINHIYKTMELYAKNVVSGGTAVMYNANQVFIITRSQEKDGTDVTGWNFTINIEKSRFVKEKSKLTFTVMYDQGIIPWSGLFDLAIEAGVIENPTKGWYKMPDGETKFRAAEAVGDFWEPLLSDPEFTEFIEKKFILPSLKVTNDNREANTEISD